MKLMPYGIIEPAANPGIADRILDEYFQIVWELGLKSCLSGGVCLGFVRDGGYLPGDNDLDVIANVDKGLCCILAQAMIRRGFEQRDDFPETKDEAPHTHFIKDGILVDVVWWGGGGFFAEFRSVGYKGKSYPIPTRVDEYLTASYGDWRVKNPNHEGAKDPKLIGNGRLT